MLKAVELKINLFHEIIRHSDKHNTMQETDFAAYTFLALP